MMHLEPFWGSAGLVWSYSDSFGSMTLFVSVLDWNDLDLNDIVVDDFGRKEGTVPSEERWRIHRKQCYLGDSHSSPCTVSSVEVISLFLCFNSQVDSSHQRMFAVPFISNSFLPPKLHIN